MQAVVLMRCFCLGVLAWPIAARAIEPLELHAVPLDVDSPRLLGMSMDDEGHIWFGSTHRKLYRYDPSDGSVHEYDLPFDSSVSQTLCVGEKVYVLGQTYSQLMIYDRSTGEFSQARYPTEQPNVWYGTNLNKGRHLYLFDRGNAGVIKWDTETDTGESIAYPYETPMPASGIYVAEDAAIWCAVWDFTDGQYVPLGLTRLDVDADEFTGWFAFPDEEAENAPYTEPASTLFYPHTLRGQLVPFDYVEQRWCERIPVPEFGTRFGFIGLGSLYAGRWYFSLSTYNGTPIGCDGLPHHFCNGLLEFDPGLREFAFPTLEVDGAYYQVSYHLSAGGHFFATGNDILEPDGSLNNGKIGAAIFWQSLATGEE